LPALASAFSLANGHGTRYFFETVRLLDPCAGDGAAALGLARLLTEAAVAREPDYLATRALLHVHLIELERHRAEHAESALEALDGTPWAPSGEVLRADALRTRAEGEIELLFLNPPYDGDRVVGRLEQRFLELYTPVVDPGHGWLLYLVPPPALAEPFARYLACEYQDIEVRRFPDPDFAAFRQLVVRARRREQPVDVPDPAPLDTLALAASAPQDLAPIDLLPLAPVRLAGRPGASPLTLAIQDIDVAAVTAAYTPWHLQERLLGLDTAIDQLLAAPQRITLPPKPAHLALALSTGLVNGRTLHPTRPDLHPSLIVKGGLQRHYRYLKDRRREDGSISSAQYTQVPHLVLHALRTDTGELLTLQPGAVPSGSADLGEWNSADLAQNYSGSLTRVLREVLPPLHDPRSSHARLTYPPLARSLFRVQDQATQASMKLLAEGATPFLLGEVGTGKSTVALTITRMLEPKFFDSTRLHLSRSGVPTRRFRPVRCTLILCPPHLVASWEEQVAAVRPSARVQVLSAPSDTAKPADIYLLSRETAKLDSRIVGIQGRACPRCGRLPMHEGHSDTLRAEQRLRCNLPRSSPRSPALDGLLALVLEARTLLSFEIRHGIARLLEHRVAARLGPLVANAGTTEDITAAHHQRLLAKLAAFENAATTEESISAATLKNLRDGLAAARRASDRSFEQFSSALLRLLRLVTPPDPEAPECGEPLFSKTPDPRRTPLARFILKRLRHRIDFLILDEVQEFGHMDSAQARAAWRLLELKVPTLLLSGSIMNGYSSSLFPASWATSPGFRKLFDRTEENRFVEQFGYQRMSITYSEDRQVHSAPAEFGSMSDAVLNEGSGVRVQEAPGVTPHFLVRHLLPVAVPMHKADLDEALPELQETRVPLETAPSDDPALAAQDRALLDTYSALVKKTLEQIHEDMDNSNLRGALWGAFAQLVFAPELFAEDCGPYNVHYPPRLNNEIVATAAPLPADYHTPKERWLLSTVRAELAQGRPVVVFVQSSGHDLFVARLTRLLESVAPDRVVFLDASRVDAKRRKQWIDRHVVAARKDVLIVQPKAIQTGLNNLVRFKTGIWYQIPDYNVLVTRQANGRLHRIGQTADVRIYYPYYPDTLQGAALTLVSQKMTASLQVDGLSLQSALEASGAGGNSADMLENSMSFGEALARLYQRSSGAAAPRWRVA